MKNKKVCIRLKFLIWTIEVFRRENKQKTKISISHKGCKILSISILKIPLRKFRIRNCKVSYWYWCLILMKKSKKGLISSRLFRFPCNRKLFEKINKLDSNFLQGKHWFETKWNIRNYIAVEMEKRWKWNFISFSFISSDFNSRFRFQTTLLLLREAKNSKNVQQFQIFFAIISFPLSVWSNKRPKSSQDKNQLFNCNRFILQF